MGPILEEFNNNRSMLIETCYELYCPALNNKGIKIPNLIPKISLTAQGGVGTFDEQNFLSEKYNVDSVGWGTPFLLVPEATSVDDDTLSRLSKAEEKDLYLSKISPLGVPFNNLRGNTKDLEKLNNAINGKPGSPCPKKYLQSNTEFSDKPICTASITFQNKKIDQTKGETQAESSFKDQYEKIIDKSCLCVGLATSALKKHDAADKIDGDGVLVCPGPNLAYFSQIVTLQEMIDHIYGRINLVTNSKRPHMFLKELNLYINYLKEKVEESEINPTDSELKYFDTFQTNLANGIEYYKNLFTTIDGKIIELSVTTLRELTELENEFDTLRQRMIIQDLIGTDSLNFSKKLTATN
jgi:hypothetical protein